jgi:hypothetical protein
MPIIRETTEEAARIARGVADETKDNQTRKLALAVFSLARALEQLACAPRPAQTKEDLLISPAAKREEKGRAGGKPS